MFGSIQATTKHAVNQLLNGGLYRASRLIENTGETNLVTGYTPAHSGKVRWSAYGNTINALGPTIEVSESKPLESLLAAWYCYGTRGMVDVKARDLDTSLPIRSINGPTPARFSILEDGTLIVEQPVTAFAHLLDREITLSFLLKRDAGDVEVSVDFVYGTTTVNVAALSTASYRTERLVVRTTTPPYDATSFTVRFSLKGLRDQSAYIGEIMLQLGRVPQPQFTDDVSLMAQPRQVMMFHMNYPAPPGFVSQCELAGRFIFPTCGDAQVDGTTRSALGGSQYHNHTGKTGGDNWRTQVEKGGKSYISRTHRHSLEDAEADPVWVKLLLVEKL